MDTKAEQKIEQGQLPDIGFTALLSLSSTKYIHERKSNTYLNWMGDVGGFNDAICLILSPLVFYYSSKMYEVSIGNEA